MWCSQRGNGARLSPGSSFSGRLPGAGPAAGLVFEDERVEELFGDPLLFGAELADGFELEAEVLVGPAGVGAEDQLVGRDWEGEGEAL